MLTKLIKHEIKSTARIFLPLYAVLMVFALLNRFVNPFQTIDAGFSIQSLLHALSIFAYVGLIAAIFVITLVIVIQRFYKNLLGDEGYLMFTLPVDTWKHISCKLLTAMFWYILSTAAIFLSVLIVAGAREVFDVLPHLIKILKHYFGPSGIIIIPIFMLTQLAAGTLTLYNAMTLGHLFPKHRLLASFGMYCILYAIYQVLMVIVIFTCGSTFFTSIINSSTPTPQELSTFFVVILVIDFILAAAQFAIVNYVLNRKLNLE